MGEKRFLILEHNYNLEGQVSDLLNIFLGDTFGSENVNKMQVDVHYFDDDIIENCQIHINVWFKEYPFMDDLGKQHIQNVSLIFKEKGYQPFYINGEFVTMRVFEHVQGDTLIQSEVIYGREKNHIFQCFIDGFLTC